MNHTKEPWEAKADPSYYGIVSEICAMDKFIASLGGVCSPDEVEANARRIVACVNACAGITNEALDAGIVKKGMGGRMTELMKRYEGELANEGLSELKRISDIAIRILNKQVEILQAENAKLRDQLRWRPVSEKPENAGWIVCKRWATSKKQDIWYVTELYLICTDDEWKHFVERDGIISYRPIPPAPEGE